MEKVYVFAWVCAHVLWGFECACGGQRSTSYIFLDQSSSYYLTRGLSLSLGPIDLARLADQRAPGVGLSLFPLQAPCTRITDICCHAQLLYAC